MSVMQSPTPPAVTLDDGVNGRWRVVLPSREVWPAANRLTMKSPAVVPACSRPNGWNTSSRIAALIDFPVTTSMTRPAMLNPALL
jgi:hypothetical protein